MSYGENDVANWAGRAAGGEMPGGGAPPPAGEEIPAAAEDDTGDQPMGQHAGVLANHAQTLRDMAEIIKADVRAAMVDDALDMGEKDDCDEACEVLGAQAEYLEGLAETAKTREAEKAEDESEDEAEDDDDDEIIEEDED